MTRINVIPVAELTDKHLIAEYREIARIPGNLNKSLNRKTNPFTDEEIPTEYVLGSGHVKFFYNKMLFLEKRYKQLIREMLRRGFNPKFRDCRIFRTNGFQYWKDYEPTKKALELNRARIKERLLEAKRYIKEKRISKAGKDPKTANSRVKKAIEGRASKNNKA